MGKVIGVITNSLNLATTEKKTLNRSTHKIQSWFHSFKRFIKSLAAIKIEMGNQILKIISQGFVLLKLFSIKY